MVYLCSTCGSSQHSSPACPKARSEIYEPKARVAAGNSATGNAAAQQAVRDVAPYTGCIRALQRCLDQLLSELDDEIALRAQIKKVEQALTILQGGLIVSAVTVDVPDVPERQGDPAPYTRSQDAREAQSKRMKDYWAARRAAKVSA